MPCWLRRCDAERRARVWQLYGRTVWVEVPSGQHGCVAFMLCTAKQSTGTSSGYGVSAAEQRSWQQQQQQQVVAQQHSFEHAVACATTS